MNPCKITEDLLPLYVENSCSDGSCEYVEAHLKECESCRTLHEKMNKAVQTIASSRNAKDSFRLFNRRILLRRVRLITLCTIVSLALLTAVFYRPIETYLSGHLPARTEPFVSEVSRLSDGSIYLTLRYTKEDVYVNSIIIDPHPLEPQTLCIGPGYNRLNSWDSRLVNNGSWFTFHILTEESAPLYETDPSSEHWHDRSYNKIVLVGSDGERVLWQEGDDVPAADTEAEANLRRNIADGDLIPAEE